MLDNFHTLLGIFILIVPFFGIFCLQDRTKAFLRIFLMVVGFHLVLALITQFFGIFTYNVILSTNIAFVISCFFYFSRQKTLNLKLNFNWFVVFSFVLIAVHFSSPHYYYSGPVNTITGKQTVEKDTYLYPYFSDEWIAVSLIDYSIENKTLPNVNPLWNNEAFPNPMVAYFSLISGIFLLLQITPLLSLQFVAIVSALLVALFSFLFLKSNKVGNSAASLAVLSLLYIVNGANLPGLWYAMPFIVSLVIFLHGLVCYGGNEKKLAVISCAISLVLYPAMIVFIIPVLFFAYFLEKRDTIYNLKKIFLIISALVVPFLIVAVAISTSLGWKSVYLIIEKYLVHQSIDGGIPNFYIWNVLSLILIIISAIGLKILIKESRDVILAPVLVGICFWLFYSFSESILLIDYPRVVVITSIFLIICSGFGFEFLIRKIESEYFSKKSQKKSLVFFKVIVLVLFFVPATVLNTDKGWEKLVLKQKTPNGINFQQPAPPVNRYLHPDDLRLFSQIKGKKFISPPWKGLVIGVSTKNYPLESKPSTITNSYLSYSDFMRASCEEKNKIAKGQIDYVYSDKFECENFIKIGSSKENLFLYKFSGNN